MKTIWKTKLEIKEDQQITIPKGSEILSAQIQLDELFVWYIVPDTEATKEDRIIKIYGTGNPIILNPISKYNPLKFINTIQLEKGKLIFHVFESII